MTINVFDKGDLVRIQGVLRDADGVPADPDDLTVKYKKPGEPVVELVYLVDAAVIRDDVGTFSVKVGADTSGNWRYRFESSGNGQAAAEGQFRVKPSALD